VRPNARRTGTATRLVAAALQWSFKKGCGTTVVNTETTNDAALGVYASFGFAPMDEGLVVLECEL
jgi:GNAT superfamily N-acetyltransferase